MHPADKWQISEPTPKIINIASKSEPARQCRMEMQQENIQFQATGKGVGDMLNCVEAYQQTVGKDYDLTCDLIARTEAKAIEVVQQLIEKGMTREEITSIVINDKPLNADETKQLFERVTHEVCAPKGQKLG